MIKFARYKDRWPDWSQRVWVYRNLRGPHLYSVMQDGLVMAHTDRICLHDVQFVIREAGHRRMLRTGARNVHAYAVGTMGRWGGGGFKARYDRSLGRFTSGTNLVSLLTHCESCLLDRDGLRVRFGVFDRLLDAKGVEVTLG